MPCSGSCATGLVPLLAKPGSFLIVVLPLESNGPV
jgi:hypothetical protein